jgi:hypothetical protein
VTLTMWHPLAAEVGNNCADKRRSLGQCSLLADYSGHRVFLRANIFLATFTNVSLYSAFAPYTFSVGNIGKTQGESVFRLHNFNIVGFFYIYFTALHVSVLGPFSSTHIFHRIYSIDNGSIVFGILFII